MRSCNFTQFALRPFIADQRLFTNTQIICDPVQTSLCSASYLSASTPGAGWVNLYVGASARESASAKIAAPHWPAIASDVPGGDGVVSPAVHVFISNTISDMQLEFDDQDDAARSLATRLIHSPCLGASAAAGEFCQVTKFVRLPCCRADVGSLVEA